jgi:LacI family transcriptional regulator
MGPRIVDIAQAAGVSPSAVSLALNNKAGLSAEVRRRIIITAEGMGYKNVFSAQYAVNENVTVRLLKIAKHGHIVNDRHNPFITEYLEGIETSAKKRKYTLEVSFFNRVQIEEIVVSQKESDVDGFIVLGTELGDHELSFFSELKKPLVFIDTYFPFSVYDCVDMDNVDGVFKAVQHFYNAGHRSIGLVKSSYETRNFKMREFGFQEALEFFSLPVQEKFIISVDPAFDGSFWDMKKYLNRNAKLPSAFFCVNDIVAYGVIKALREAGLDVPKDVSVIGFDDLPSSSFSGPPLTTVRVSTQQIGQRALEKLSERISFTGIFPDGITRAGTADWPVYITENILIAGKLVIRSSVRDL